MKMNKLSVEGRENMRHSYHKHSQSYWKEDVSEHDSLSWCWGSAMDLFHQDPWENQPKKEIRGFLSYITVSCLTAAAFHCLHVSFDYLKARFLS